MFVLRTARLDQFSPYSHKNFGFAGTGRIGNYQGIALQLFYRESFNNGPRSFVKKIQGAAVEFV
jgi:hypothetical protein